MQSALWHRGSTVPDTTAADDNKLVLSHVCC